MKKSHDIWSIGHMSELITTPSPLSKRFNKLGLVWQPYWHLVKGTYRSWLGEHGHGHGSAPAIYTLSISVVQELYVANATDEEILALYEVLSTGTEQEQEVVVRVAFSKAVDALSNTSP